MSKGESPESILEQAESKEKEYAWLEAAELYEQALNVVGGSDFTSQGEIQERIGHCFYRFAFQADNSEEFKGRVQRALESSRKAHRSFEQLTVDQKTARIFRCDAVASYLSFWLASDPSEKRRLLDECLELEAKALEAFSQLGKMVEYGKTYSTLPLVFGERARLEWSGKVIERIWEKGVEWGETAVVALSAMNAFPELVQAYYTLSYCHYMMGVFIPEPERQEKNEQKTVEYLNKAVELAARTGSALFLGLSNCLLMWLIASEEGREKAEEALRCGERIRDALLISWSLSSMSEWSLWKAVAEDDPEKLEELMEDSRKFYDRAHQLHSSMPIPPLAWGGMTFPHGWLNYYWIMAEKESYTEKRWVFLKKAEEAGSEALRLAESSYSPQSVQVTLAFLSAVQVYLSQAKADFAEKRHRLKTALGFKEKVCQVREEIKPFDFQPRGVGLVSLGWTKMHLADLEPDVEARQRLLEEASLNMENGLKLFGMAMRMKAYEKKGQLGVLAVLQRDQGNYATLLTRLYHLTHKPEHLRKAIRISLEAIDSASKLGLFSRIAESHWKIAMAQDLLGDHMKAAEGFQHSSESFRKAAEEIPQLNRLYQDHALYMEAWNEIEKARYHHAQGEYGRAKEHYKKAADLHKSTRRWNHLSLNYAAWASVDEAEELSRKGQAEEAKALFEQAAKQFDEAEASIEAKLDTIEAQDEKEIAIQLDKASDTRRGYCLGRTQLEEAKILDMQGDHGASARSYGAAAEQFRKVADAAERESDRQELTPLIDLCHAWQTMTRAEAEAQPDLYLEAAQIFDEAKEHSLNEKARVLALGHSSFCKALEAGARFEATRDMTVHSASKRHMEAAENFYLKAGFKIASEYVKATLLLSDAYMYMHKAETTADPKEKTQYYQMAEKLLQASAGSYMKAKHPEKSDQVQRLLEGAREKRKLAISLAEVLHAPTVTATSTSFSTPTSTHEQAVGLDRFEHADVQANLILKVKEVKVGEDLRLAIELVNAGKAPALLIKVDEVTPEGFEIREVPEIYTFEDSYIDMKGKRLNPLRTEDLKVVVMPRSKGTHTIKPRILYIDETGKYKSHEPEPVTITVKELGIKGWIKGEE